MEQTALVEQGHGRPAYSPASGDREDDARLRRRFHHGQIDAHTVTGEPPVDELWTFMRKPDQLSQPNGSFAWTVASIASISAG